MRDATTSLFVDAELARAIEAAERSLIEECAMAFRDAVPPPFAEPVGGGAAVWARVDSPFNKVVGAGLTGSIDDDELDRVEAMYAERDAPVQFEVSTLADPSLAERLTRRGYVLAGFENVLGVALHADRHLEIADRIAVAELAPHEDAAMEAWLQLDVDGSTTADGTGTAAHEEFDADTILRAQRAMSRASGFRPFLGTFDSEHAGAGGLRMAGDIAQLCGASTLPRFRRLGVQSSLLSARLAAATAAGCRIAVVTVQPGSTSQRNVQRHGFQLLYVRSILVKSLSAA